jgi:hypothetical protein
MRNIVINICLVSLLAFSSKTSAGQEIEGRVKEISKRKAEVQKVLSELRGRVFLDRSVYEFFDEMGLFDNQLYGRLHSKENYQDKVKELETDIDYLNTHLVNLRNNQNNGQFGPDVERNQQAEINLLETMINTMHKELDLFQVKGLLEGGTELLGVLNFDKDEQLGRRTDSFSDPIDRIEYYLKVLEALEEEEKKLEKENMNSAR